MKDKILIFVIGLLVGAIITATGFLINQKVNNNNLQMPGVEGMQMMERPDGETPPEKPEGMEDGKNDGTRPEVPTKNDSSKEENKKDEGVS